SENGYDFSEIGKVKSAGNSTREISYNFIDHSPLKGDNYYRLTQTDFDGKYKSFPPVHVTAISSEEPVNSIMGISPVPFDDHFKIDFSLNETCSVNFVLTSDKGEIIRSETINGIQGFDNFSFNDLSILSK